MDECEQVEKKIDLEVHTASDSTIPMSPVVAVQPAEPESTDEEPLPATQARLVDVAPKPSGAGEISPIEWHMSAAKMKPLPAHVIAGASATQALNRPLPILGQALGLFSVVGGLAWLWAHHMLGIGGSLYYLLALVIFAVVLVTAMLAAMKMQAKLWTELLAGASHPLAFLDKHFLPLSVGVLGDALQGYNDYLLAAACYGELVRSCHPLEILSKHRSFERELIISLAYAGQFTQALFYAGNAVRYAEYLISSVETGATRNYYGFATRTAAMVYELAGDKAKANELREKCYESGKKYPLSNETRLFANLARAEAYCQAEDFNSALPLLLDFVQTVSSGHKMSGEPSLRSRAYHLLAICYARLGNFEEARRMHKLGCAKGSSELSTFAATEGVCAEVLILSLSGMTSEADALIEKSLKKLRLPPGSVLWRRLTSLQSKPSSQSEGLCVHFEHEQAQCECDDEPAAVPILVDDRRMITELKRSILTYSLTTVGLSLIDPHIQFVIWFLLPALGFGIFAVRSKSKRVNAAASAIANGKALLVKVKLSVFTSLTLYRDDGKGESYRALCSDQMTELHAVTGESKFEAVAYANDTGEIVAVQLLGHYASVKRVNAKQ